ncbi:transglutaminase family protein [Flavobacterium circumlabens]|uniref:Transglutaminase family protein n=1 Tax=Flavobacterium circumlabens TaxID=2133765 RepID=A0A4Y7UGN1_9FLAO|nr:transglutaminase family protein [Flavobacterium circumlabens]TCN60113.1 transglutaminase-like putative cysteine protease [Flavobacterium circumlabens]TEB45341.1 transglutaminase family protein [Flavobacterium circumlabens]
MAIFKIVHLTKYQYNYPIKESINEIRLFPHHFENQEVLQYQILITHNPDVDISEDYYGNRVGNFNVLEAHSEMTIESRMLVRVNHSLKIPDIDPTSVDNIQEEKQKSILLLRLCYRDDIQKQNEIAEILKTIKIENKSIIEIAQQCNTYVFENFTYTKGITNIETTVDEILTLKKGVCQDFAHILLQLLRTAGIPSRYVSGYICPNESGLRGEGATHAWVEIYTPKQGWLGLDPTNNIWTMDNHVRLSVGRNFTDCTPIKGTFKGLARQTLSVCVSIGYEDGRQFEEINDVKLQEVSLRVKEQLAYMDHLQQQQQQ